VVKLNFYKKDMKKFKVRITQLPTARTGYQVQGALVNDVPAFGGADYNAYIGKKPKQDSKYLTAVPRSEANLEAEDGETAFGDINGDGFPEHKIIKGKRHYEGGVPLNLPDGTFIFSDTKSMKISDCTILKMFGKPCGKQSYTPADLAKPYDINKYRVMLEDPDSDEMTRRTAEMMIKKYVIKLGALALAQEAKKGFPQGIPEVAQPYMEAMGLSEEDILPNDPNKQQQEEMSEANSIPQMPNDQEQPVQDQPDGSAPTQMPNGEPIAQPNMGQMPEGMSPEMMQQAPMAAYGMEMGGYGMPFYNNPYEMAYGGMPKLVKGGPGEPTAKTRAQLQAEIDAKKYEGKSSKVKSFDKDVEVFDVNGKKLGARGKVGVQEDYSDIVVPKVTKFATDQKKYERDICAKIRASKKSLKYAVANGWIAADRVGDFKTCVDEEAINANQDNTEFFELEPETPNEDCQCEDSSLPTYSKYKDADGNCTCTPPTNTIPDKCHCPDPNDPTKQIEVDCPEDGSDPICGERSSQGSSMQMQQGEPFWPEWRQQDINNMRTVMNEKHGKQYPIMSDLDMPEMQPVYNNWLGAVQSNLASEAQRSQGVNRAAGNTAAKQAVLTQMQSNPETFIEGVNKENVGTENQLDRLTNFNVRDKNMTNRANANQNYMKELGVLNEGWNQEMNAWNAAKTLAQNTGLTNAANTYNDQTEQYAIDPRSGVGIFKGGKRNKPEINNNTLDTLVKYKELYPGIDDKVLLAAINRDAGNTGFTPADMMYQAYGGPVYANGGFVYADTVYPFIF
jgi:hypothetical protein